MQSSSKHEESPNNQDNHNRNPQGAQQKSQVATDSSLSLSPVASVGKFIGSSTPLSMPGMVGMGDPDVTTIVSMSDCETTSRTSARSYTGGCGAASTSTSISWKQKQQQQYQQQRPILVGYAFGPKKMSTMSVVMAEASMAVSTVVTHIPPRMKVSPSATVTAMARTAPLAPSTPTYGNERQKNKKRSFNNIGKEGGNTSNNGTDSVNVGTGIGNKSNAGGSSFSSTMSVGEIINNTCTSSSTNSRTAHYGQFQKRDISKRQKLNLKDECQLEDYLRQQQQQHQQHAFTYDDECCSINTNANTENDSIISTSCATATASYSTQENNDSSSACATISCIFPSSKTITPNSATTGGTASSSATTVTISTSSTSATTSTSATNAATKSFKPFPGKYIQIPQHYQPMRVSFVPLDLDSPLEEQHGGKFDAILHKITEDILCKSQIITKDEYVYSASASASTMTQPPNKSLASSISSPTSSASTLITHSSQSTASAASPSPSDGSVDLDDAEKEAMRRIQRLLKYKHDHPACCLVDHPTNVEVVMSRSKIAHTLNQCLRGVTTKSGISVRTPRFLVLGDRGHDNDDSKATTVVCEKGSCNSGGGGGSSNNSSSSSCDANSSIGIENIKRVAQHDECNDSGSASEGTLEELTTRMRVDHQNEIAKQIEEAPFTYPLIVKPLTAAGTSESHRMGILLGRNGISSIHTPCLLQEYANHDGVLYKVYVLGSRVWVFNRPSLPNLPLGESLPSVSPYVEFDSQRPYPKISDFGVVPPNKAETVVSSDAHKTKNYTKIKEEEKPSDCDSGSQSTSFTINNDDVTCEEIRPVADCIRRAFGLELFGFDIIVTKKHTKKEMFVVDVNYFPSYKEVTNFSELLAQYLAQCGIEGRVRSFESER
eukprot:CAMPEP_0203665870 /NCGR_PEP_ID=MMETSP0090-20130426/3023_1 /ASSEMBLY_ACC=CAM_ASM_001088 /TAXON_ID=426623 /ORGANISM="Chaetoceros affinis, Strain CCMP159" /LENGTH=888 /DNA_ID=CAMNT_0050529587 /DNA_START=364 /DNA_END=3030 /DNA_ORIENTATION=-